MADLPRETVLRSVTMVLSEAFEGPADPRGTWFVNNAPDSGIFGTLDGMTAGTASRAPGAGRRSVAAHAHHLRFSLEVSRRFLQGERGPFDWARSWAVDAVDEAEWSELRAALRRELQALRDALPAVEPLEWLQLGAMIGAIAHSAYHLGAIRQIALEVAPGELAGRDHVAAAGAE